ncbi:phosphoric diester hydrolase [Aureococcus anophagefferens]|nr:phosphoric diester hydrolase [Aureococcus anophagefferens]
MMWILLLGAAPRVATAWQTTWMGGNAAVLNSMMWILGAVLPWTATAWQANWMGGNAAVLGGSTLLDLSLPGTHDALTYDLSTTVSEAGIDDHPALAAVLHAASAAGVVPEAVGAFVRGQAQTQALNVSAQLDAGVRFVDFRVMYTSGDWYGLHLLQAATGGGLPERAPGLGRRAPHGGRRDLACCRDADGDRARDAYPFVATVVAYNVRTACAGDAGNPACAGLLAAAEARRGADPRRVWEDPATARLARWPPQ